MFYKYTTIFNIRYHIYISFPAITEYGIEILASPGIPGIDLENRYYVQRLREQRPNDENKFQHGMGAYSKIIVGYCG